MFEAGSASAGALSVVRGDTGKFVQERRFGDSAKGGSIVIPSLEKVDKVIAHSVDQAVPGRDPPRPDIGSKVLQRFRFSNPAKWVPHRFFHQIENPKGSLPIGGNPMLQVLHAFVLNDGGAVFLRCWTALLAFLRHGENSSVRESQFLHEGLKPDGRRLPALGPSESCEESGGIGRGPKQMGGFLQAGEFVGRKKGHRFMATAFQNGRFAAVLHVVPDLGEVRAGAAVGGSSRHGFLSVFRYMYSYTVQSRRPQVKLPGLPELAGAKSNGAPEGMDYA